MPLFTRENAREMNKRGQVARLTRSKLGQQIQSILPSIAAPNALQAVSDQLRLTLAHDLLRLAVALAALKVGKTMRSIREHAAAIEPIARAAKVVLGWSDTQASPLVNLQVLGEVKLQLPKGAQATITEAEHAPQLAQEQSMLNTSPDQPQEKTP